MEVSKILYAAAKMLGINAEVQSYFEDDICDCEREALALLQCYNLVETELALDYFPLKAEDTLLAFTGQLDFDTFTHAPVRILGLKDDEGKDVEYELFPTYLKTKEGVLTVTYTYTPNEKGVDDVCECGSSASEPMFLYGTLAHYALTQGMYEEAVAWEKKYKKAIEDAFSMQTCKRLKSRRWV